MQQIEKNTVESKNQLQNSSYIRFFNTDCQGKRIMFLGNSITLHGIKASIGWHNEWGMAASALENDYVHILMRYIKESSKDVSYCICQGSEWEQGYTEGEERLPRYERAKDFSADIIVMRIIENVPAKTVDIDVLEKQLEAFLKYLSGGKDTKIIFTTSFWKHPGDVAIRALANKFNSEVVELGDLGELDEMKATGLFEHKGVAMHPGDKGMKEIADRIWNVLKKMI